MKAETSSRGGGAPDRRGAAEPLARDDRSLRRAAGLLAFPERGVLHLAGPEGVSFLQGLVTTDLLRLEPGRGRDAAFLTPTGKLLARAGVFRTGPEALYLLSQAEPAPLVELLDRYHFGERVEISDLTGQTSWWSVQGPAAPEVVAEACGPGAVPGPWEFRSEGLGGRTLRVFRMDEAGLPGLHVLVRDEAGLEEALRRRLEAAAERRGGGAVSRDAWEVCRVEAGTAWMGVELDESVLPMEAGLQPLLDASKGCYVGQEVVARAQVQGRTNWSLWGVTLPADERLARGRQLLGVQRPRPVLRLRSVVRSSSGERIGLAFVHREAAAPGPLRVVDAEAGELEVWLHPLPFPASERPRESGRLAAERDAAPA